MPASDIVHQIATGNVMDKLLLAKYREGVERREQPLYTVKDAAYYLGVERLPIF